MGILAAFRELDATGIDYLGALTDAQREYMLRQQLKAIQAELGEGEGEAQEIRKRVLEAAEYIPVAQLGTTDDCGFSPFSDDTSPPRDTAFAKIRARVAGTAMASELLGDA